VETLGIRKIKLNGIVLTWSAYLLDRDDHGRWAFSPTGTTVRNHTADAEWFGTMGAGVEPGFLWLLPDDSWFFGAWWRRPDHHQVAIDACTPPALVGGLWTWTDLELDICRDGNGNVWVEDEDEFDESLALHLIDADAEAAARAVTDEMVRHLTARIAPFDDTGWTRLDAATALGLAPLEPPAR
jgi:hypothetical protein